MSFFDVSPMGGRSMASLAKGMGGRSMGGLALGGARRQKKATMGGLFLGGADMMGDFDMRPLGSASLGGSAWSEHVAKYRAANPTVSYKDALKEAKKDYTSVAKAKVNKSGKTRRVRAKSTHAYNISNIKSLRPLTPDELVELAYLVEQMLPKKFKGAGVQLLHGGAVAGEMHGGGLFGSILGNMGHLLPF